MYNFSYRIFLCLLFFAPLAFGTVEHWSLMVVEIGATTTLLICLFSLRASGEPFLKVPGLLPLFLFIGLMVVQLIPLPPFLLKIISPHSWEAYLPVYQLVGEGGWVPISVNQKATLQEFFRIAAYVLFYILTIQVLRGGQKIKDTVLFLALFGSLISFFAVVQQFSSEGRIYWFRMAPGGFPGGPWININQYAAFIGALCPLVLALFLFYRPRNDDLSFRNKIVAFFSSHRSNLHLFLGFGFVLLFFSVLVSLCRGGIITILASMILFALLASYKRKNFSKGSFWVVLCIALLSVSSFGWDAIFSEFDAGFDPNGDIREGRFTVWSDTLVMIKDYLFLGGGFGTYVDVYPSYKTIAGNGMFEHAHNDYLELLSDGGIVGFGLAAWFCLTVLLHGWKMVRRRRDRFAVLVGVGAITSICALLMHSVVDFNLHNGAVGLYFFFICGLLVAVVNNRYTRFDAEPLLGKMGLKRGAALLVVTSCFLIVVSVVQSGVLFAGYKYSKVKNIYVTSHLGKEMVSEVGGKLQSAMVLDPLEGLYPFYRGNLSVLKETREQAFKYYLQAARKQPMNGIYLQRLGMMQPIEKKDNSIVLMKIGYDRAVNKELLVFSWVEWLLAVGKRQEAIELLRDRFVIDPAQIVQMIPVLDTYEFTRSEMEEVMPESVDAWIRYGKYIEKMGNVQESVYYRKKALEYLSKELEIKPEWFKQLIGYYKRNRQPEKALEIVRLGIEHIPDNAYFHVLLGDYYKKEGITYRAKEEYERAVMLEPGNEGYRKKLRKLKLDIEFGD